MRSTIFRYVFFGSAPYNRDRRQGRVWRSNYGSLCHICLYDRVVCMIDASEIAIMSLSCSETLPLQLAWSTLRYALKIGGARWCSQLQRQLVKARPCVHLRVATCWICEVSR